MKFRAIVLVIVCFATWSCTAGQHMTRTRDIEVIDYSFRLYAHEDSFLLRPFWPTTERTWRKDSFAIEEVRYIKIDEDSKGRETTTYPVRCYRFSDLRKKAVYEFERFSDTSCLERQLFFTDTVLLTGGFQFYLYRGLSDSTQMRHLPDTVIRGTRYGHAFFTRRMSGIDYNIDGWFLTEKKNTRFSLDQASYKYTGIPMVGYHLYPQGKIGLKAITELTYIADTLTQEEEKVFAAWEKYAREHPVKEP